MSDPFEIDHESDDISAEEAKFFEAMKTGTVTDPTSAPSGSDGSASGSDGAQGGVHSGQQSGVSGAEGEKTQGNQGNDSGQNGAHSGQAANQDGDKQKFVPHQALHEERTIRQRFAEENATLKQQLAALGGKLETLNELVNGGPQGQKGAPAVPDPEQDIIGWAKAVAARMTGLEQGLTKTAETTNQELAARDMQSAYERDARSYVAKTPDFFDAYNHLIRGRAEELKLLDFTTKDIAQIVAADERDIVARAYQNGKSPADVIYNMAKRRGYAAKEPAQPTGQQSQAGQNNNSSAAEEAAKKLEAISKGQNLNGSLSGGGADSSGGLTLQKIVDMDEDELEVWLSKSSDRDVRALLGG